jgi:FAD/FMN-containing dehydrogenase
MRQRVVQASNNILSACAALGGHATIPWCPSPWKNGLKVWGLPCDDFAQMLKLKKVFDPDSIFSPGRFVGEI